MEKNIIISNEFFPSSEEVYQKYILETKTYLNKYPYIKLSSKILHYLDKPSLCYYCTLYKNANFNPFKIDILFCFEFIDGEIPYVTILTDFIKPSLNDNRNYYRCLTKEHNYFFSLAKPEEHKNILESMIIGINNFLTFLNDSLKINSFIFFGEYEYRHIYQINDFLQNKNYLNFYRINEIINNKEEERYIIFTKLYFLLFMPLEKDKTHIKLLFCQKLKDINISFDKNSIKDSLIIKFSSNEYKNDIEFVLIDRRRQIIKKEDIQLKKNEESKKNEECKKNEIKEKPKFNYSILIKEWFIYIDNIDFSKYDIVVNIYQMIFNDYRGNLNISDGDKNKIEDYNKLIEFYEKLITFYENKKNKNKNEILHKIISNIIYLCSELVNYAKNLNKNENEYLLKVKKYLNMYK